MVARRFSRLHDKRLKANRFFNGYVQTYVERDVRSLINLKDLGRFQQFLTLMAGRIGQVMNHTSIGNDIGISSTTVKLIDALKASYLVFELRPDYQNIRKQAVSLQVFFHRHRTGRLSARIGDARQLARDPLRGGLGMKTLATGPQGPLQPRATPEPAFSSTGTTTGTKST